MWTRALRHQGSVSSPAKHQQSEHIAGDYYPLDKFPRNAEIFGFGDEDKCCRRVCHGPDWRSVRDNDLSIVLNSRHITDSDSQVIIYRLARCGHETFGCDGDEDCYEGLECTGADTERRCVDIDECQDPRYLVSSSNESDRNLSLSAF